MLTAKGQSLLTQGTKYLKKTTAVLMQWATQAEGIERRGRRRRVKKVSLKIMIGSPKVKEEKLRRELFAWTRFKCTEFWYLPLLCFWELLTGDHSQWMSSHCGQPTVWCECLNIRFWLLCCNVFRGGRSHLIPLLSNHLLTSIPHFTQNNPLNPILPANASLTCRITSGEFPHSPKY